MKYLDKEDKEEYIQNLLQEYESKIISIWVLKAHLHGLGMRESEIKNLILGHEPK